MRRLARRSAIALAAVVTLFATATPASAAPEWQTFKTNSRWKCSDSWTHPGSNNIIMQTCMVTTANELGQQGVTVVLNKGTKYATIWSKLITNFGGDASCVKRSVAPGEQLGCFGPTVSIRCGLGHNNAFSDVWMNANIYGYTDYVYKGVDC